jgi:xylan 1,4-beta-xylosidase
MTTNQESSDCPGTGLPMNRRRALHLGGGALAASVISGTGFWKTFAQETSMPSSSAALQIVVDLTQPTQPLPHFWERCVNGDHAKQALRRDYQHQLARCHRELGFQSLRFHNVLASEMSVYFTKRPASFSRDIYSFFNVDQVYDFLVNEGMHPYVELSSMPRGLATDPNANIFSYSDATYVFNTSPPNNFSDWGNLVKAFVSHLVSRYGIQTVRTWPFEVWNEPNPLIFNGVSIGTFWTGTMEQYFELYRVSAEAIKSVDASIPVGGPAVDAGGLSYFQQFLDFVTSSGVPLDFCSSHGYESDRNAGPNGPADIFTAFRQAAPSHLPLYISEFGVNAAGNNDQSNNDTSYAAASILKTVHNSRGIADILSFWDFSDITEEQSQASNPFYGGWGLLNIYGVPKPAYRAFQLLHELGDQAVAVQLSAASTSVGALATTSRQAVDVLVYNHTSPIGSTTTPQTVQLSVRGLRRFPDAALSRIDAMHANPYQAWIDRGSPEYPTAKQIELLVAASELSWERLRPASAIANSANHDSVDVVFELELPADSVTALRFSN